MKMFGNGLKTIEDSVTAESKALHKRFEEKIGKPIDPHHDLGRHLFISQVKLTGKEL